MVKQTKEEGDEDLIARRSFLGTLWAVLGLVALFEFLVVGIAFFKPPQALFQVLHIVVPEPNDFGASQTAAVINAGMAIRVQ